MACSPTTGPSIISGGVAITNVYNQTVINNTNVTRTSFNGGTGGTAVQLTYKKQAAAHGNTWPRPPCKLSTSKRRAPTGGCWQPKTMAIRRSRRHPGRPSSPAQRCCRCPGSRSRSCDHAYFDAGRRQASRDQQASRGQQISSRPTNLLAKPPENKPLEANRAQRPTNLLETSRLKATSSIPRSITQQPRPKPRAPAPTTRAEGCCDRATAQARRRRHRRAASYRRVRPAPALHPVAAVHPART